MDWNGKVFMTMRTQWGTNSVTYLEHVGWKQKGAKKFSNLEPRVMSPYMSVLFQ